MSSSHIDLQMPRASSVEVNSDQLIVALYDGRTVSVPLAWYPRLLHASPNERSNHRFIGSGEGIRWPDLDEDVRVVDLLAGRSSQESQASLARWLQERAAPGTAEP